MNVEFSRTVRLDSTNAGKRLDQVLAGLFPEFSRSMLKRWLLAQNISVDGAEAEPSMRVKGCEQIVINAVVEGSVDEHRAQEMALDVVFKDRDLLFLNKPAGLVVHPAAGHRDGTLLNGLLYIDPRLAMLPRCGIVHRLDKDTSGILVVARTVLAHTCLVAQLQARSMHREYRAVVQGALVAGATIDAAIGRHPRDRIRMAVVMRGRPAVTHYRIADRYRAHSLLDVNLETGRTHQIRVHMAHIRHPIVGDRTYGGRPRLPAGASPELRAELRGFPRQALHARRLQLVHPRSREKVCVEAPFPEDFKRLCAVLQADAQANLD